MAEWRAIQDTVRREHELDADLDDEFTLTVHWENRAQRVMVHRYEAWGQPMLEVRSAFGEVGDYESQHLLADSLQLPVGAIALHGRFLVVVQKVCLDHTTVEGVMFLINHVGMLADVLEERRGGDDRF